MHLCLVLNNNSISGQKYYKTKPTIYLSNIKENMCTAFVLEMYRDIIIELG